MGGDKKVTAEEKTVPKTEVKTLFEKAIVRGEPQNLEKDDVLDIIFWLRMIIAFAVGLLAGVFNLTG